MTPTPNDPIAGPARDAAAHVPLVDDVTARQEKSGATTYTGIQVTWTHAPDTPRARSATFIVAGAARDADASRHEALERIRALDPADWHSAFVHQAARETPPPHQTTLDDFFAPVRAWRRVLATAHETAAKLADPDARLEVGAYARTPGLYPEHARTVPSRANRSGTGALER